jgi:predicted methyltransferase
MSNLVVLSHFQAEILLENQGINNRVKISTDLGRTQIWAELSNQVTFPGNGNLSWVTVEKIADNENNCFVIENGEAIRIQTFSETFNRVYSLYPSKSAPSMLISGIPMHRVKDTDPWRDTQAKIKAFGRVGGQVLDTATGLGYTAIVASQTADRVITVELDTAAQEVAQQNPWSQELFGNPKIEQMIGDSYDVIDEFPDDTFSGIIHDPPMFSMSGELYSLNFYQKTYRVLKSNGRMFHYIGNPESKSGARITRGVVERLKKAGFASIIPQPRAFGVLAKK